MATRTYSLTTQLKQVFGGQKPATSGHYRAGEGRERERGAAAKDNQSKTLSR